MACVLPGAALEFCTRTWSQAAEPGALEVWGRNKGTWNGVTERGRKHTKSEAVNPFRTDDRIPTDERYQYCRFP